MLMRDPNKFTMIQWMPLCLTLAIVLVIAIAVYNSLALRFIVDDAYITMRYSRHLAEGHGPVYNLGERVEGYTNFLWMVILSLVYKIGLDMPSSSQILGITFGVGTLLVVWMLSFQLWGKRKWLTLLPLMILANNRTFTLWSTSGLETSLFTFLLTLSFYLSYVVLDNQLHTSGWLALSCLLLMLTRPEGAMITALVFLMLLFYRSRFRLSIFKKDARAWLVVFIVPLMLYGLWKLYFYHDLLPNTFYNKVNSIQYFSRGFKYLSSFLVESWLYLWLIPIVVVFIIHRPFLWMMSWVVIVAVYVLYTVWVGGDWMGFRYYAPIMPLMAMFLTWASSEVFAWFGERESVLKRVLGISAFSLYLVSVVCISSASTYFPEKRHIFEELATRSMMNMPKSLAEETAEALAIVLKPDEVIAHSFAGFPAVYTDIRVIDMLGQNDPVISRQKISERSTPGHEKHAPPGYLSKNRAIFLYPWIVERVFFDDRVYTLKYKEGKYIKFNSTWSPAELVKRFGDEGFEIYYEGVLLNKIYSVSPLPSSINFDFETGNYKDWQVKGRAFDRRPAYPGKWDNTVRIKNYQGNFYVNSFLNNSDFETGELLSTPFTLSGNYIRFLIGGGYHPRKTCINLLVDGNVVKTASGNGSEEMHYVMWDVKKYRGESARIQIVDDSDEKWGHILIDDIAQVE